MTLLGLDYLNDIDQIGQERDYDQQKEVRHQPVGIGPARPALRALGPTHRGLVNGGPLKAITNSPNDPNGSNKLDKIFVAYGLFVSFAI